ncbi:LETM1-related biofilm-associated protein [Flavobacterium azooxidireducens]|uniref:LETM1-related biofilm-associated protein n=1 Tax=Flavobacterium azooxidireducens TaxID=1871076 RepID=A0ABY4KCT9_9FLAO|nr:LETM1-related biofilm-associated protein [Flavobacterium azooxidireducens]UPQ78605.1 LETM1-related biofilm-associated protein [Flavobacterium azooxidireducens]
MINPSAQGWVDKFFSKYYLLNSPYLYNTKDFYCRTRETGFIYGHVVSIDTLEPLSMQGWTSEEVSKVALLNTLFGIYQLTEKNPEKGNFIDLTLDFYNLMHPKGFSFFKKILPSESKAIQLEKIIDSRVQTNDNIVSKNFSHIVTNALLFIDVLAFHNYLVNGELTKGYVQKLEEIIVGVVTFSLTTKSNKSHYDDLLIKLFETSVRYTKFSGFKISDLNALNLDFLQTDLEKYYVMDLAGMAIWSDEKLEKNEVAFLYDLGSILKLERFYIVESLMVIDEFIKKYRADIPYFNYSNPIKHFYDQTTQSVVMLITRNRKRLYKELTESKDLVKLLAASTTRELDANEKKRMKKQLLDVCKTIPSLTIFLLPGGSLLLPILIKFIPQMLPSAFNENLD